MRTLYLLHVSRPEGWSCFVTSRDLQSLPEDNLLKIPQWLPDILHILKQIISYSSPSLQLDTRGIKIIDKFNEPLVNILGSWGLVIIDFMIANKNTQFLSPWPEFNIPEVDLKRFLLLSPFLSEIYSYLNFIRHLNVGRYLNRYLKWILRTILFYSLGASLQDYRRQFSHV